MNLISCSACGVVLDKDKLDWPSDIYSKENGQIIDGVAEWDGDTYVAISHCPLCDNRIREKE